MAARPASRPGAQAAQALPLTLAAQEARRLFPRGLCQPAGSFRFSADALLLASWARARLPRLAPDAPVLDLGCGCGVVGFAFLLACPRPWPLMHGLEREPTLVAAARQNAAHLEVGDSFHAIMADVADANALGDLAGQCDVVLANPPFRRPDAGKTPESATRRDALFTQPAQLSAFFTQARRALRHKGYFFCLLGTLDLVRDLATLIKAGLEPKRLCFIHGTAQRDSRVVLVEARPDGRPGCLIDPPLIVWSSGAEPTLTPQALALCPYLACNAQPGASGQSGAAQSAPAASSQGASSQTTSGPAPTSGQGASGQGASGQAQKKAAPTPPEATAGQTTSGQPATSPATGQNAPGQSTTGQAPTGQSASGQSAPAQPEAAQSATGQDAPAASNQPDAGKPATRPDLSDLPGQGGWGIP